MKLSAHPDRSPDRRVSWIAALWAALVLLAAGAVLSGSGEPPAAHATVAVVAGERAHPDLGTPPSTPGAPAASDQLAPTP